MLLNKLNQLKAARAKVASLEKSIETKLNRELAALPEKYGFESASDLAEAIVAAAGKGAARPAGKRRGRKPAKAKAAGGGRRRKRAKITDETREQVKKMVAEGKTGTEIAKTVGISLPSVQNIKKAAGLVNKR
ncbi:MAG: helix-turn-helix domain-containing protein [Opitutaceae bacterium]